MLIKLKRNIGEFWVNPEHIVSAEPQTGNTTFLVLTHNSFFVRETPEEINKIEAEAYALPDIMVSGDNPEIDIQFAQFMYGIAQKSFKHEDTSFEMGNTYDFEAHMSRADFMTYIDSGLIVKYNK
jgi:uncharacterized protein YlzI (FlbEa/FlbD family)